MQFIRRRCSCSSNGRPPTFAGPRPARYTSLTLDVRDRTLRALDAAGPFVALNLVAALWDCVRIMIDGCSYLEIHASRYPLFRSVTFISGCSNELRDAGLLSCTHLALSCVNYPSPCKPQARGINILI